MEKDKKIYTAVEMKEATLQLCDRILKVIKQLENNDNNKHGYDIVTLHIKRAMILHAMDSEDWDEAYSEYRAKLKKKIKKNEDVLEPLQNLKGLEKVVKFINEPLQKVNSSELVQSDDDDLPF